MDQNYLATHEIAMANIEQLFFDNIPNVRESKPGSINANDVMAARLNGADPTKRVGTAIMLKTMPGDHFSVSANAYYDGTYRQNSSNTGAQVVESLLSALLGGNTYAGVPLAELPENIRVVKQTLENPALASQLESMLNSNNNPDAPKAHLNILFFDDKMQMVPAGSQAIQVTSSSSGSNWSVIGPSQQVTAPGAGYVLIYIDNQSTDKDVWFDNVTVGHYKGEVIEESHYYPFGLTLQSSLAASAEKNDIKFQGQKHENDFSINMFSFKYRDHDPQIGRFWQVDPLAEDYGHNSTYAFSENKVVNAIELEGLESLKLSDYIWRSAGVTNSTDAKVYVKEIVKEQSKPKNVVRNVGGAATIFSQTIGATFLVGLMTGGAGAGVVMEEGIVAARTTAIEATEITATTRAAATEVTSAARNVAVASELEGAPTSSTSGRYAPRRGLLRDTYGNPVPDLMQQGCIHSLVQKMDGGAAIYKLANLMERENRLKILILLIMVDHRTIRILTNMNMCPILQEELYKDQR